jgi:Flp pilus assembly protein TadD
LAAENEQLSTGIRARLHYNIGVCHFRLGRTAHAIPQFKRAILLKTDYARAYYALGMAQAREKQWKAARASFERVVSKDPANGEAWFDLAFSSLALGDIATARSAFARSIEFGSIDSAMSHNNIGVILAVRGEFAAAEERFENAVSISGGRLFEAKHNLEFCRAKRVGRPELIAKEFLYSERNVTIRIS